MILFFNINIAAFEYKFLLFNQLLMGSEPTHPKLKNINTISDIK